MSNPSFTNRLATETSPYLQQHAHNPVDWYPWGTEALERAKKESRPIFLSIGYSACHWCHVMERESFEDAETAKIMNEHFVNIKVDREERQDLDNIYMSAVQLMTQRGGWPMSVFLTPDLEPFYGGTYFPPEDRMGLPSFKRILLGVSQAWKSRREEVSKSAKDLVTALEQMSGSQSESAALTLDLIDNAADAAKKVFDSEFGGLGSAPKFFHTMDLRVCLRHWRRTGDKDSLHVVRHTLENWARGGIYDHVGGGFHRYSTDQMWLVPHFEKMLYDNALVPQIYLEAYQATHDLDLARIARETLDYVSKEMTSPEGGFYSTQDADSEGEEGKFYVWKKEELEKVLDPELAEHVTKIFNVSEHGNWEHTNILNRTQSWSQTAAQLGTDEKTLEDWIALARRKLFAARSKRVEPFKDTKIIVAWNGLMIDTLAQASQVLGDSHYLEMARRSAGFLMERLWDSKTRSLRHSFKDGKSQFSAYLDDYAAFVNGLVTLYEASFDRYWLDCAEEIGKVMIEQFWDEKTGTFFYTSKDHEKLVIRPRDSHDGATPSGSALAALALIRLGRLFDQNTYLKKAERLLQSHGKMMKMIPSAAGQFLVALEMLINKPLELVFVPNGTDTKPSLEDFLHTTHENFVPNKVLALYSNKQPEHPLFKGRKPVDNKTTVYVCESFSCREPITSPEKLKETLA
jgi:uncharacterized protein